MANKKQSFWYVLVLTDSGARFVTAVEHVTKYAHWDKLGKPLELGMSMSKDLAMGLMCNGYIAFPICNFFELTEQPYKYDMGEFQWVSND